MERPIPKKCPFCGETPKLLGAFPAVYWIEHSWNPKCPMTRESMPFSMWERRCEEK